MSVCVYTVDAGSSHLQEIFLPALGQGWKTQDMSGYYGTPPVAGSTQPAAVSHDGVTSVYTVVSRQSREMG